MGDIVLANQPCPKCGSSDALQYYADGGFCFSCKRKISLNERGELSIPENTNKHRKISATEINTYSSMALKDRKIPIDIMRFFNVKVSYNESGEIDTHYYPYDDECTSYKIRHPNKEFEWLNKKKTLFGLNRFKAGGKKIIICEGEIDTLSIATAMWRKHGKIYPCCGLSSSTATKDLIEVKKQLDKFDEVILMFDEDDAGSKARKDAARILGFNRVKITSLPSNDANEVLKDFGSDTLMQCVYDANKYTPAGVISGDALWDEIVAYHNKPSIPYPECIASLNEKTKGIRLGEISLFISGTSCGKSTIMREIVLHLKETTEHRIGVISLEDSPGEIGRKLSGMVLKRNPAKEEIPLEELKEGFDQIFSDERILILDHQGAIDDDSIFDILDYMVMMDVSMIIIDHVTMLVSEGTENLRENAATDKVMNSLLKFVKRNDVWIGLVSHLRKTPVTSKQSFEEGRMPSLDDIKGSGAIKQVSFDIIGFARNLMAENPLERNTINLAVLKCRFTGLTGEAKASIYNFDTGRFEAADRVTFVRIV